MKKILVWVVSLFILAMVFYGFVEATMGPEIPRILPRKVWLGSSKTSLQKPRYGRVRKFIVHHTAHDLEWIKDTEDYKKLIRIIYNEHLRKGWKDIGYNYIVAPDGTIYEGRAGGNGVVGVHCEGFNTSTVGIAILGCYGGKVNGRKINEALTSEAGNALIRLIAWLAANNGIDDLNKKTRFNGELIDGVLGHRDLNATQCPGDHIYELLDYIQLEAQKLVERYKKLN